MTVSEYKTRFPGLISPRVSVYPVREDKILLGLKKVRFGEGKYTSFGGKLEEGETYVDAAVREIEEECGLKVKNLELKAITDYYAPYSQNPRKYNQSVYVFLAKEWEGEPIETEEIQPIWFDIANIPYDKMWSDTRLWLPQILKGERIYWQNTFDAAENVIDYQIRPLE